MNEGISGLWIWMIVPLVGLSINLIWPRKRGLKVVGIALMLGAAHSHGCFGLNDVDRNVALAERIVEGQREGTPGDIVSILRSGRSMTHQTMDEVSLVLTLAVLFAAMPVDTVARLRSRYRSKDEVYDNSGT